MGGGRGGGKAWPGGEANARYCTHYYALFMHYTGVGGGEGVFGPFFHALTRNLGIRWFTSP